MKSFHKIVSEVAEPKAGDEKHFKDKHVVTKVDYPVDVEAQFTGGKIAKAPKRKADLEAGEDEKVYEAMDPVNKKAALGKFKDRKDKDIDNDGDVDSSDKYIHNRRNAITKAVHKEEVEGLDEISRDLARRYIRKVADKTNTGELSTKQVMKRKPGIELAGKKAYPGIAGKAKVPATESVEELDELSKKTLGSYVNKAAADAVSKAYKAGDTRDSKGSFNAHLKALQRQVGIGQATSKLAKEEVEELDELSKKTLGSYVTKAAYDTAAHAARFGAGQKTKKGDSSFVKAHQRLYGIKKASDKLAKEEVELDEVSTATLQRYKSAASKAMDRASDSAIDKMLGSKDSQSVDISKEKKTMDKRSKGVSLASNKLAKEEFEQIDELSKKTLGSYVKKAAGSMAGKTAVAAAQASSSMGKTSPDIKRGIVNRMKGITRATDKLTKEEANMAEDAWEEVPMMMSQLEFICYAAEEIMDYLDMGIDPEEWYQNKLANAYQTMMSLYSYARGEMRMTSRSGGSGYYDDMYGEEVEIEEELKGGQKNLDHNKNGKIDAQDFHMMRKKKKMSEESNLDESITKMTNGRLKFHMNTGTPHGSYTKDEMKAERDRRLKTDPIAYRSAKASINEVTQTAMKKTVTYIDPKGHSRTRDVPVKRIDKDEHGQDKMRESVEILDEAFKVGIVKLKDGGSVVLKKEDVDLLNKMFKDLSTSNRKKMQEVAMKDKSGFEEILSFAREAI